MSQLCERMSFEYEDRLRRMKPRLVNEMQESVESLLESIFSDGRELELQLESLDNQLVIMNRKIDDEIEELKKSENISAYAFYDKLSGRKSWLNPQNRCGRARLRREKLVFENRILKERIKDYDLFK